jgi:hypothetical protein
MYARRSTGTALPWKRFQVRKRSGTAGALV